MKFKTKAILGAVCLMSGVIAGHFISNSFSHHDEAASQPAIKQSDDVALLLTSIQNRGKLVFSDINMRVETTNRLDSSVYDASVASWSTARVQAYLELSSFQKSWIQKLNGDVGILIPKSAIHYEIIPTGEGHEDNRSWAFFMESGLRPKMVDANRKALSKQLQDQTTALVDGQHDQLCAQLKDLIQPIVKDRGIEIMVAVDEHK